MNGIFVIPADFMCFGVTIYIYIQINMHYNMQ